MKKFNFSGRARNELIGNSREQSEVFIYLNGFSSGLVFLKIVNDKKSSRVNQDETRLMKRILSSLDNWFSANE